MKNAARKLQAQNQQSNKSDWQQQKELEAITRRTARSSIRWRSSPANGFFAKQPEGKRPPKPGSAREDAADSKLFEEVATPEMREAQKKLMDALRNMDKQQLQDAIKDFELSQKELLERLERTLAL